MYYYTVIVVFASVFDLSLIRHTHSPVTTIERCAVKVKCQTVRSVALRSVCSQTQCRVRFQAHTHSLHSGLFNTDGKTIALISQPKPRYTQNSYSYTEYTEHFPFVSTSAIVLKPKQYIFYEDNLSWKRRRFRCPVNDAENHFFHKWFFTRQWREERYCSLHTGIQCG